MLNIRLEDCREPNSADVTCTRLLSLAARGVVPKRTLGCPFAMELLASRVRRRKCGEEWEWDGEATGVHSRVRSLWEKKELKGKERPT